MERTGVRPMTKTEDTMILELRQLIGELRQKRLKRRN